MSEHEPIKGKVDASHHSGRHSLLQRLQAAEAQFKAWLRDQETVHEAGHEPVPYPSNPYLPEGEGTLVEEGVIFTDPLVRQQINDIRIPPERPTYQTYTLGGVDREGAEADGEHFPNGDRV